MKKTNAVRILDKLDIKYELINYKPDESIGAIDVALKNNQDIREIYKTLVLVTDKREYLIVIINGASKINLKKLAKLSGCKKVDMIKEKDLFKITGYIRGGCSPIGMKKTYRTFLDNNFLPKKICISGGKRGIQIYLEVDQLKKILVLVEGDIINS